MLDGRMDARIPSLHTYMGVMFLLHFFDLGGQRWGV